MSSWQESTNITDWVDEIYHDLKSGDSEPATKVTIFSAQEYFMTLSPKEKATAFIYLLGKVVRDEQENPNL